MSIAIHWFRRDLRLTDNSALNAALAAHDQVIPLYIASTWTGQHWWCGAPRQAFLCGSLESLHRGLERKGARLIVRSGGADAVLSELVRKTHAAAIYFNRDPDPFGREMERRVEALGQKLGVAVHACHDVTLHEPEAVLNGSGQPFRVFTAYAKAWSKRPAPAAGRSAGAIAVPARVRTEPLPTLARWSLSLGAEILPAGEAAARERLARFLDGPVFSYAETRALPGADGTSRLSQDLRHGLLSIREVFAACHEALAAAGSGARRQGVEVFLKELAWREFYMQVLWHRPDVLEHEYQEETRGLAWRAHWRPEADEWAREPQAQADFAAWQEGRTGFPIVDAGMRELAATGFLHNRVRMIVAMFLSKDLRIWWMHGESHFLRQLVDGEIANNNGNWQWSASTGTDAAPYFRIQNPWAQTKRYDPEGAYIRRWLPELRDVLSARLCRPPQDGTPLAKNYPLPIADHARAREDVLEMFRSRPERGAAGRRGSDSHRAPNRSV